MRGDGRDFPRGKNLDREITRPARTEGVTNKRELGGDTEKEGSEAAPPAIARNRGARAGVAQVHRNPAKERVDGGGVAEELMSAIAQPRLKGLKQIRSHSENIRSLFRNGPGVAVTTA